ncbi:hypothetical protein [Bacillus toyonensis]|uniref:hypothetical protein n=1 Tax=Bacillus toyonensis TaxID=155322 RepID=UPI00027BEAA4|nr:hypothetical protein [Bacillus toyonensis]EJV41772.1 hypothetical protein IEA_05657 [Bacillus toyonensis]
MNIEFVERQVKYFRNISNLGIQSVYQSNKVHVTNELFLKLIEDKKIIIYKDYSKSFPYKVSFKEGIFEYYALFTESDYDKSIVNFDG